MQYLSFILLIVLLTVGRAFAQNEDITVVDTSLTATENQPGFFAYGPDGAPIPKKTLIYSLILPGMGQAYNRRWWKLPFVYGAVGGVVYAIDFNQRQYRRLRDALELKLNDQEHEFTGTSLDNANALRSNRDTYDRFTQMSYMATILVYGVIAIEAFTDAHLQNFDISDDLSMEIRPSIGIDELTRRPNTGVRIILKPHW
ncbi:MAG TPA: DUF5683 domain-containing protein [Saprospiraceae bacterium]|nr:DUF5683 domain-containing protein [Saprospiraceae bacterium]